MATEISDRLQFLMLGRLVGIEETPRSDGERSRQAPLDRALTSLRGQFEMVDEDVSYQPCENKRRISDSSAARLMGLAM